MEHRNIEYILGHHLLKLSQNEIIQNLEHALHHLHSPHHNVRTQQSNRFLPPDCLSWRGWRCWHQGWSHPQRLSTSGSIESWPRPWLAWWEPCQWRRRDRESSCGTSHLSHKFSSAATEPLDDKPVGRDIAVLLAHIFSLPSYEHYKPRPSTSWSPV